jgi:hypothetical protein
MKTIKVTYDPSGIKGGKHGCYRSMIVENPGTRGAGTTAMEAAFDVLRLAPTHDLSGDVQDYYFDYSLCPSSKERERLDEDHRVVSNLLLGVLRRPKWS